MPLLTHEQAKAFYDTFGARQDAQAFYEDRAVEALIAHGDFAGARAVIEFGCGTGRLAATLLGRHMGADATYVGLDVSTTMVELARKRLEPWRDRAEVRRTTGSMTLDLPACGFDRFVSTYVLDLLGEDDISRLLAEARRLLSPDGRLCLAGLTHGRAPLARLVSRTWQAVHALRPSLVGGCRPIAVAQYLDSQCWKVRHREVISRYGVSSEVLVAEPRSRNVAAGTALRTRGAPRVG
jgi:ubiquinone/menaquinone biosynthesis C-methylase UbiE